MSINFEPPSTNLASIQVQPDGVPATDINSLRDNAGKTPISEPNTGGVGGQRIDTGHSQSVIQSGGQPHMGDVSTGHNVPDGNSPILPRPDQHAALNTGGTSRRAQRQTTNDDDDPLLLQNNRQGRQGGQDGNFVTRSGSSSNDPVRDPTSPNDPPSATGVSADNQVWDPQDATRAQAEARLETIRRVLDDTSLPQEVKDALEAEIVSLTDLVDAMDAAELAELELSDPDATPAEEATGKVTSAQSQLKGISAQVELGQLGLDAAADKVDKLVSQLQTDMADIDDVLLKSQFNSLIDNMQDYASKLRASAPVYDLVSEMGSLSTAIGIGLTAEGLTGDAFNERMTTELINHVRSQPGLTQAQQDSAVAIIQSWGGVPPSGAMKTLGEFLPGLSAGLQASANRAVRHAGLLLNSGLINPRAFSSTPSSLGGLLDSFDPINDPDSLTPNGRFKVAVNYMAMMAKIMAFLSLMKAQINSLDGESIQEMAQMDRDELSQKLDLAYASIAAQLEQTTAQQRAMVMEQGMTALTIIIAAISVVLALIAVFSAGTLAGLVMAIIALVIAALMFVIECSKQICKACGVDNVFQAIAKAVGDPEAAQKIEMIFGAVMAVASIGTIAGAAAKLAANGAALAIKLSAKMGVEVVKGVGGEIAKQMAKQIPKMLAETLAKQVAREVAGAGVRMVLTTTIGMVVPLIATEIAKAAAPEDEETQMILQILLSIILMIGVMAGGMVGGKAISGGFGPGGTSALSKGKDAFAKVIKEGVEHTADESLAEILKRAPATLKIKAFFKQATETLSEFFYDPAMGFKGEAGGFINKFEMGARMFQATAGFTAAVISMKQAQYRLEATEASLEAEVIQGLIDILNALRGHRGRVKDNLIEDLTNGIAELVTNQHRINNETYSALSRVLDSAMVG